MSYSLTVGRRANESRDHGPAENPTCTGAALPDIAGRAIPADATRKERTYSEDSLRELSVVSNQFRVVGSITQ